VTVSAPDTSDGPGTGDPAGAPPRARARPLRQAAGLALFGGVVAAAVLARDVLGRVVRTLGDADPVATAAAVGLAAGSMLLYARMQAVLLRGAGVATPFGPMASLAFAAHSLSISLPGGPLFSTTYNFRRLRALGAAAPVASWVIAVSGVLSTAGLAVVGVLGGLLAGGGGGLAGLAPAAGLGALLAAGTWLLRARPGVVRPVGRLLARVAGDRARAGLEGAVRDLGTLTVGAAVWARATLASVGNWLLDAASLALCCWAVGVHDVGLAGLLLAYTACMAAAHATLVPSGLGVADAALAVGLSTAGAAGGAAVAATVLYRLIAVGAVNAAGWWSWWRLRTADAHPSEPAPSGRAAPVPRPSRAARPDGPRPERVTARPLPSPGRSGIGKLPRQSGAQRARRVAR
jgi:uncharacterized membrane protein YbhN (UPF0104 family)